MFESRRESSCFHPPLQYQNADFRTRRKTICAFHIMRNWRTSENKIHQNPLNGGYSTNHNQTDFPGTRNEQHTPEIVQLLLDQLFRKLIILKLSYTHTYFWKFEADLNHIGPVMKRSFTPIQRTSKIIVYYMLILRFLYWRQKYKGLNCMIPSILKI